MINVLVICSSFSSIVLIVYLLNIGKIGSAAFTTLFVTVLLFSLALYGFDRLRELDIKNFKLILDEAKQIKIDIYAKAETVKKLGEEVAELTTFNVTRVGRFAGDDLEEKMIEARDKIKNILYEIGSSQEKIKTLSAQIEDVVLGDLKNDLLEKVHHEIRERIRGPGGDTTAEYKKYPNIDDLIKKYDENQLIEYFKQQSLLNDEVRSSIEKLYKFIKDKEIQ